MKDEYGRCIPEVFGFGQNLELFDPDAVVASGTVEGSQLVLTRTDNVKVRIPLPQNPSTGHTDLGGNPI